MRFENTDRHSAGEEGRRYCPLPGAHVETRSVQKQNDIQWRITPCDHSAVKSLSTHLAVPPIIAQLLVNRGLTEPQAAKKFLHPSLDDLHEPEGLDGITEAVRRINKAVAKGEKILIYGDYDVDGMTATALLYHFFSQVSAQVSYFLPTRIREGYGLHADRMRDFGEQGVKLVITADCGITAREEAALARELGIDLIVTDHHEPEGALPEAVAVIDPKKPGSTYPYRDLAGVGVAFKLAWAAAKSFSGQKKVTPEFREFLLNAIGLVALGTIADVAPLTGENRIFVSHGLGALANTKLPGLRALMSIAGLKDRFSARDVAFRLAPRLNATGRLNEPLLGFELLTTNSFGRALDIATQLDLLNRERQSIERAILADARRRLSEDAQLGHRRVIVLAGDDWHIGVIGVVASRLAEEFYRPTVLLSVEGGVARGSARSIPAFHILEAFKSCDEVLLSYGGHAQAAGITIETGKIDALREMLEAAAAGLTEDDLTPMISVDAQIPLSAVTTALVRQLEFMAPFGEGNPRPLFATTGVSTAGHPRRLGTDGQHVSFVVRGEGASVRAIAFGRGELAEKLENHAGRFSIVFEPQLDTFGGEGEAQLVIRDLKLD